MSLRDSKLAPKDAGGVRLAGSARALAGYGRRPRLPSKPHEVQLSGVLLSEGTWKTVARGRTTEHAGARVLPSSKNPV
jgi:hypothetical protein